jgi:hypothetical protein
MTSLTAGIIIISVTLILRHFTKSAGEKAPTATEGGVELRYPLFMASVGYAAMGFGALIGIITRFQIIKTTGNEVVPFLIAFFIILGLPLVVGQRRIRLVISDRGLLLSGLWKRYPEMLWLEIRSVDFNAISQMVLRTDNNTIRINIMLVGFASVIEMMKQKLDPAMYEKALRNTWVMQ